MLNENLKNLRTFKGLSQEELATKLNVVRQTVSKWEKGLSVPDSEMLIKIAEDLETSVSTLLGQTTLPQDSRENRDLESIAMKLELLNEQLAKKAERKRKIWRGALTVACVLACLSLLWEVYLMLYQQNLIGHAAEDLAIIGGADGPTTILVSKITGSGIGIFGSAAATLVAALGIYATRKK